MGPHWGLAIGDERIEGIVLEDAASPRLLRRMRISTESSGGYYHVLGQIHKLVEVLSAEVGIRPSAIGVAHRGALDPITKTLKGSGDANMDGKPLRTDLETYLGVPVSLGNAGNCLALAETRFGAVPDVMPAARVVLGIHLGQTVEAGIIINGRPLIGRQGIAGSWGHNFLDESGGTCACGRIGCVDTVLSVSALEDYYEHLSGRYLPFAQIVALAEGGADAASAKTLERLVYNLARALGPVINLLDPDCIVVGGPGGQVDAIYKQGVELLKRFVHNTRVDTLLLRPKLGVRAGVYGAGLLA